VLFLEGVVSIGSNSQGLACVVLNSFKCINYINTKVLKIDSNIKKSRLYELKSIANMRKRNSTLKCTKEKASKKNMQNIICAENTID